MDPTRERVSASGGAVARLKRVGSMPRTYSRPADISDFVGPLSVSVVIPFYNRDDMICECVESVVENAPFNTEVVVVDDGSDTTDGIRNVINNYKVTAIRLNENRGISAARNVGNTVAIGDVIIDIDSDDLALPGSIEAVVREIEDGAHYVYGNVIKRSEDGSETLTKRPEWKPNCLFNRGCFIVGMKGYLRSLWSKIGGFNEAVAAAIDLDFALRAEEVGAEFARAPEHLVVYRSHPGQISTERFAEQNEAARAVFSEARKRRGLATESIG